MSQSLSLLRGRDLITGFWGENGLRITVGGKQGSKGLFVDEVIDLSEAPEFWAISRSYRVAFIVDVTEIPECLQGDRKLMKVDAYIKKQFEQCQDAWTGPTGSRKKVLACVTILDEGNSATQDLLSAPIRASKIAESTDIAAVATHVINQHCKAKGNGQFPCGGHAVMRKYRMLIVKCPKAKLHYQFKPMGKIQIPANIRDTAGRVAVFYNPEVALLDQRHHPVKMRALVLGMMRTLLLLGYRM
ncbi:hypothetical protein B0H14DRAFT_3665876 [Mycena olivaceomarginata]|nr:hypothetical protein B0H14DRAFT_3665876 [Mycena olivaceomarginata]